MSDQIMQISDIHRQAIEEAVHDLWYVEQDRNGRSFIELDAGSDSNHHLLATAYDHREDPLKPPEGYLPEVCILYALQEAIWESYLDPIWIAEAETLRKAGFAPGNKDFEQAREWLQENYPFQPPYDHYLSQDLKVNILLHTPEEANEDHALIHQQFLAMVRTEELSDDSPESIRELLDTDSSLTRLVIGQGYTMEDLRKTLQDYYQEFYGDSSEQTSSQEIPMSYDARLQHFSQKRSKFLVSLAEELDNQTYEMGCLTLLSRMDMKTFSKMMAGNTEITLPADTVCGIFNPWNGSGSVLGIDLEKPISFSREDIYDIQIEEVSPDYGYLLGSTYGLWDDAWTNSPILEIGGKGRKPSLDDQIRTASSATLDLSKSNPMDLEH